MTDSRWLLVGCLLTLAAAGCGGAGSDGGAASGTGASGAVGAGGAGGGAAGASTTGTGAGGTATGSGGTSAAATGGMGGGAATAGGTGGSGGGSGGGAGGNVSMVSCTFTVDSSVSEPIPTVGIVTWSTDLAGVEGASIDFGRDTSYGMTAPVDLVEPNYRTLLLGMKASTEYHFRITANAATGQCQSQDFTLTTGSLATNLPNIDVNTVNPAALTGGFLLTGQFQSQGGGAAPAYILDADGDIVWWYSIGSDVTGVRMSYDGKYMWINSANVPDRSANVHRVSMDGMMDEDLSSQFAGQNHQLTVLPDETVAFYAYGGDCDDIKERAPNGTVRTIINAGDAHGAPGACHVNTIQYSEQDDTLVFSDLDHDNYTKVTRSGEVVWVLGGSTSSFQGDGASWSRQHGLDVLGLDRLLIFNNGSQGGGGGSLAIEILLDLNAMTATRAWTYAAQPAISNQIMGDVERLDNGNTIVAYSTQGVLHEVDANQNLVQELVWPISGAFGYIIKRPSLYGLPPK